MLEIVAQDATEFAGSFNSHATNLHFPLRRRQKSSVRDHTPGRLRHHREVQLFVREFPEMNLVSDLRLPAGNHVCGTVVGTVHH